MDQQLVVNNLLIKYFQAGEPFDSATVGRDRRGSAQGFKTLLFLHGWRSNKEIWKPVLSQLFRQRRINCQLLAIDLPGFGGSQVPQRPFSVLDYAEVVKGFMEKLELKNVIIVGHSFGGRIGIKLAANYPSMLAKLVLVDSAGFAMDAAKKSTIASVAKFARPFFKPKFMQPLRKKIYKTIGAEDYLATLELQATFVKVTSEDLTEDLKKISCPTLIVYGENDYDTPVEFGQKMQSIIPNSQLQILNNAGHFSFLDKQGEFNQLLINFL